MKIVLGGKSQDEKEKLFENIGVWWVQKQKKEFQKVEI